MEDNIFRQKKLNHSGVGEGGLGWFKKSKVSKSVLITHRSLFDGSVEGIKHKSKKVFSVQYHPEASPGPHDSHYLFKDFILSIKDHSKHGKKKRY